MGTISVSQINNYLAKKLREDYALHGISVEGEISKPNMSGGHMYLTLKDEASQISCTIWASNLAHIDKSYIEAGKKIIATGDINLYAPRGTYSLNIREISTVGVGDLMAEFLRIQAKLKAEGLFDDIHKQEIPAFPRRIGVVTSAEGAAIEDIKKIITQKNNYVDIIIFPTMVQGINAPESIVSNIKLANKYSRNQQKIDTLIVGRGGGSPEDLAAFNDEGVARAIYESEIPIISAVGHESDESISDYVADIRAATPTAAAERAVPNTAELSREISTNRTYLGTALKQKFTLQKNRLDSASNLIYSNMRSKIKEALMTVEKSIITIRENNPNNILQKGYSVVFDGAGGTVTDISQINIGEDYEIILHNGAFTATAKTKESGNKL